MIVIFFLIPLSILAAAGFLALFIWAVRSGQYEDTCTPAMRVLVEESKGAPPPRPPTPDQPPVRSEETTAPAPKEG